MGEGEIEGEDKNHEVQPSPLPPTPSPLPRSLSGSSPSVEIVPLKDMIVEAVRVIHQLCKYQHELPREVYSRILLTLQNNYEAIGVASSNWSDGAMWMRVLGAGESRTRRATIFNMLECMGAWEWYDCQVKLAEGVVHTRGNKPVARRGAAIHVMDKIQGKSVRGVGRVTVEEGQKKPDTPSESAAEQARIAQRKNIRMQLTRGHKLKEKLVKGLGLGILLSPKIW
jgi:hypothetical protein